MRDYWHRITPEHRARLIAGRDPDRVRESDRKKMAKRRANPTPSQAVTLKARDAVRLAKMRGDLRPEPCGVCGDKRAEAHHDDYSRPLNVRWLCVEHHREHHQQVA